MAASYWGLKNIDDDPNSVFWNRKIGEDTYQTLFYENSPEGGFFVKTGTLAFSVGVYTACAFVCLGLLFFRRIQYGGELGGPWLVQIRDSTFLFCLWVSFVIAANMYSFMAG